MFDQRLPDRGKHFHGSQTAYRSIDLDQSDISLFVDISDLGIERGSTF